MARNASPKLCRRARLALLIAAAGLLSRLHGIAEPVIESATEPLFYELRMLPAMREGWDKGAPTGDVKSLLKEADALLTKPVSPITEKEQFAASGDPHDYFSFAIYWWPNPITRGLPYIRRDGEVNPDSQKCDRPKLDAMAQATLVLSKAFAITGEVKYAQKAEEVLRIWFVSPETRMNPHLQYAQAWPGWKNGTPFGCIDAAVLARKVPAAIFLLRQGGALSATTDSAVREWFRAMLKWMEESDLGKEISAGDHNISSWYDMERVSYALVMGDHDKARTILREVGPKRIGVQIKPDGRQPAELKRTKAFDYSCYNLDALMTLCELGEALGVDLWHYEDPKGGSIAKALNFLIPYAREEVPFPYQQLKGVRPASLERLLLRAAPHFPDAPYKVTPKATP